MLLDVRLLFMVANVVGVSGRGGVGGRPCSLPLCSFIIACELCRIFIASTTLAHCIDDLQYWTWQWADSSRVGVPQWLLAFSPSLLLLLRQVALCQCQMLILIMPTDLTSGHRIQSITVKYVHKQKSHENRISRVKFEEKQIRVHKKHKRDRMRVAGSARQPS